MTQKHSQFDKIYYEYLCVLVTLILTKDPHLKLKVSFIIVFLTTHLNTTYPQLVHLIVTILVDEEVKLPVKHVFVLLHYKTTVRFLHFLTFVLRR